MGACVSQQTDPCDVTQALIVDVQKVIADYVWLDFLDSHASWWKRLRMKRRDYTIEVPVKFYHFEKTHQELHLRQQSEDGTSNVSSNPTEKVALQGEQVGSSKTGQEHAGLQTHFRNDTGQTQTYSFKFEKTRQSSARVSYQKGFSFGASTDFSLGLPAILPGGEMGADISMNMEVTKAGEQTFEETSTATINSEITVSPYSVCVADVVLEECHFTADYKVYVIMAMPAKASEVCVCNKHNQLLASRRLENLRLLFPGHDLFDEKGIVREDAVQFVVEGIVNATQSYNQRILLDSQSLQEQQL